MKKRKILLICLSALLVGCNSNSVEKTSYIAGTIMENPKDNLTTYERNNQRAKSMYDTLWQNFYDEDINAAMNYFPYVDDTEMMASVWHYTSLFSATIKLYSLNKDDSKIKERLNKIIEGMEYYKEKRNDKYRVYAVERGFEIGKANTGLNTNVYDDNMWIAREFLNAYELLNDESLLTKAKEVTEYILTGWDSSINPETNKEWGGIYWGPSYLSKHACSNGPFISSLVRLYEITKEQSYLDWAKKVYDFGYKTFKMSNDLYGDMIGTEVDKNKNTISHGSLDTTAYTYNSGTMISGGSYLYKVTKDERYLKEAKATAKASFEYFGNGDLVKGVYQFPVATTLWFNLTLFQGYFDLYKVDPIGGEYLDKVQTSIDFAYNNYLYQNSLPVNWILGWAYGLKKDTYKDIMDESSNIETYCLLAQYENLKK